MTKHEAAEKISERCGVPVGDCVKVFEEIWVLIKNEVLSGRTFTITGFGTFSLTRIGARKCRDPRTGEPVMGNPRNRIHFRPSPIMKRALNK